MSFILDALKKSENERQRQVGPSLADVQITRRHSNKPWWVIVVAGLLIVNLGVLSIVLLRDDPKPAPAGPATAARLKSAATPAEPTPSSVAATPSYQQPQQVRSPEVRSLADEAQAFEAPYSDGAPNRNLAGAATVPEGPPLVRPIEAPDVAPLPSQDVFAAREAPPPRAIDPELASLPTFNDITASGTSLPDMHLDIHVHSEKAAQRFIFVNMRKYLEGETLREGPTVERITSEGVVLNQQGLRFLLPRQ